MVRQKRGFTLVELLVVITIIGMLMALLLPAVQNARESGRRTQCMNNQYQLTKAAQSFETQFHYFPPYAKTLPVPENPVNASWIVLLLPYMERRDVYDMWQDPKAPWSSRLVNLGFTTCPSNPPDIDPQNPTPLAYVINTGIEDGRNTEPWQNPVPPVRDGNRTGIAFDHQVNSPLYNNWYKSAKVSLDWLTQRDGSSNTLLISENMQATRWAPLPNVREADIGMIWDGWPNNPDLRLPSLGINAQAEAQQDPTNPSIAFARPSSRHPGGVVATFADGHSVFLRQDMDYQVFRHIMTPDGKNAGLVGVFNPDSL